MNTTSLFLRPALEVAPFVLGAVLSRTSAEGTVSVRLTEVEAYLGVGQDPGSHSHRGLSKRNAVMFGPPSHLYTYFTYGMHVCANIVCSPVGQASGILFRAGEVIEGVELAQARRGERISIRDLSRGPARLVQALGIPLSDGGANLALPPYELRLVETPAPYLTGPRTGISGVGGSLDYPWRFWLPNEPTVSPYKKHPQA